MGAASGVECGDDVSDPRVRSRVQKGLECKLSIPCSMGRALICPPHTESTRLWKFAELPMWSQRNSGLFCVTQPMRFSANIDSRRKASCEPRFLRETCERTLRLVQEHLAALQYTGPVCLSCDDTNIFGFAEIS